MEKRGVGQAGQACGLGEPGVANGTAANSIATSYYGPRQEGQAVIIKPIVSNYLRIQDRGLGQREPTKDGETGMLMARRATTRS